MKEVTGINQNTDTSQAHGSSSERRHYVLEQYERLWEGVYEKAKGLLEGGERDLSRLHLLMRRNFGQEFSNPHLAQKYREHERQKAEKGFIYDKQIINVYDADSRVVTLMTDAVKMREVVDAFGSDVERVVETGAGWSKTLFNIWLYGGPGTADYYALELTNAGRRIAELIAKESTADIKLHTQPFDYYEPDFSFLSDERKTCFVTHHSIEQIPEIGTNYIDGILAVPGFHSCVHIEPVGWQITTNNWLNSTNSWFARRRVKDKMKKINDENRRFSEKRNQNHNLYPLLREYEKQGKIRIYTCRKYLCSHLIDNATTLIVWGKGDGVKSDEELVNARRDDLLPD